MRLSLCVFGYELLALNLDRDRPDEPGSKSIEAGQSIHLETAFGFSALGSSDVEAKR